MSNLVLKEVLFELTFIRWLLIGLVAVITAYVATGIYGMLKRTGITVANAESDRFRAEAQRFLNEGAAEKLRALSRERLVDNPDDVWALYYFGVSNFRLGNYPDARAHLTRAKALMPDWANAVDPYIREIDAELGNKKPRLHTDDT